LNKPLWVCAVALVLVGHAQPLHAETQTWFGFQVGVAIGDPPPPVSFRSEPRLNFVGEVEVVDDSRCHDDVFRTENIWWRLRGGYWYRAASWRGPWVSVDVRRVPERVLVVPEQHWKHHPRMNGKSTVELARDGDRRRGRDRRGDGRDRQGAGND
jgi:hypothetical protein